VLKPSSSPPPKKHVPSKTMSTRESVQIPDDRDFNNFRTECNSDVGWSQTYNKSGIVVWIQILEVERSLHKIKCRMECKDIAAETLYDVLHDIEYRKKWDTNVIETFDIGKLTVNSDVGYYASGPGTLKGQHCPLLKGWRWGQGISDDVGGLVVWDPSILRRSPA
uniref:START domain-containing protein n=1 Tax=Gopherus agassizii TaxID=38772 RepID=A0A452GHE4_9SAUR